MKDDMLEKEFEEYFKGVNTPNDITADAKKYVKPKNKILPKFVKFASIAASFVLVAAIALTIALRADFKKTENTPPDASAPSGFSFYTDGDLDTERANPYSLSSLDRALKFIETFAFADHASINNCEAGYKENELALVKADVSIINGLYRDDTKVYVEFTDENLIYGELADYYDGKKGTYRGAQYYLTETTAENGELQFKLHVSYRGVKYYFDVHSSDKKAYEKYLNLIVK